MNTFEVKLKLLIGFEDLFVMAESIQPSGWCLNTFGFPLFTTLDNVISPFRHVREPAHSYLNQKQLVAKTVMTGSARSNRATVDE